MKKSIFIFSLIFVVFSSYSQINVNKITNKAKSEVKTTIKDNTETEDKVDEPKSSQILYVSKENGSNKNDGSQENPLKNIDKAIELADAGAKIYIAGGVYMGTFNIGYLETDKPIQLYGSWDEDFTKQDIVNNPTLFQPDNESAGKSRKALLHFTKDVAGTVVDNIVWDMGERNAYSTKEGFVDGVETGRILESTERPTGFNSTVEEPCIKIASATTGGDITIQNCVFVNSAGYAIFGGHRSGVFTITNNIFVANKMAAIEVWGTCAGSKEQADMIECGQVEISYNTILFSWSRLKDLGDMGYGARIMTKCSYDIHNNIIGCSIFGGIDDTRFCKDEYIQIDDNILFGNKGGDLKYSPASNTDLDVYVDEFEDLEFASVSGNIGEAPEIPVNQAYLKGFFETKYSEVLEYDPNSAENQWARNLGMNQQGTMSSSVSMFANRYPWEETLKLFGAKTGYGAQVPKELSK